MGTGPVHLAPAFLLTTLGVKGLEAVENLVVGEDALGLVLDGELLRVALVVGLGVPEALDGVVVLGV